MAILINLVKCNGCAKCEPVCPMAVMIVKEKAQVIEEGCNECGFCIDVCPENALTLPGAFQHEEKIACNS